MRLRAEQAGCAADMKMDFQGVCLLSLETHISGQVLKYFVRKRQLASPSPCRRPSVPEWRFARAPG